MNIGVDFHLVTGKFQGSRTYLYNVYKKIGQLDRVNNYYFLYNHADKDKHSLSFGTSLYWNTNSGIKRLLIKTKQISQKNNFDFFHFQHLAPIVCPSKIVLTIHDIIYLTHPEYFRPWFRFRSSRLIRYSCKTAYHIFVPSIYTKKQLVNFLKVPEDKITITQNGIDFSKFHSGEKKESIKIIYDKYGFKDFILSVGHLEPRKNHINLIKAYHILRERNLNLPHMVFIGQKSHLYTDIFLKLNKYSLEKDITVIENVNDINLPHFYKAALLFAYPSFAEGFGIPPLEAMASGCPVITSNTSALPEIVGQAGLLINPNDAEELADTLFLLIQDSELREKLAVKGKKRAENFQWGYSAKKILEVYNRIN
jgi:glycosyltransferase involved in cell wall biosynthesis